MRKIVLFICLYFMAHVALGQLTANQKTFSFKKINGTDTVYVYMFNGITPTTEIAFSGTYTAVNWYKFTDKNNSISNLPSLSPEDSTGYILNVDGKITNIWVIDYKNYPPVFNSFEAENIPNDQCENVKLLLNCQVPLLYYKTPAGVVYSLPRDFTVKYQTLEWTESWKTIDTIQTNVLPATEITVKSPLCDTYFTLSGDQYATELEMTPFVFKSSLYAAVAVKCVPTSVVTIRTEKNEEERPSQASQITGSAPMDIQFLSNANEPVALYYKWEILKDKQLLISRTEKDHRYTFTEAGVYNVRLVASNAYCSYSDSITITVSESALYVPNVFTPNGDGFNDEFRVAYKSLTSFQCWVYNRWGRKVYFWTDPQKGWDGNIGGKKATPGPYFYVIKAVGSDGIKYTRKGDINLLRGKE